MKFFCILLTLACFCNVISAQDDEEYSCPDRSSPCVNLSRSVFFCRYGNCCERDHDYFCSCEGEDCDEDGSTMASSADEPWFLNQKHRPHNVSVTEGDSVTFSCSAVFDFDATVSWLQNGQPINTNNPPERFVFSSSKKSLTIRNVCRDCTEGERKTDQMVIQCNIHVGKVDGYEFASGFLNVIIRTEVMIRGPERVLVDFREQNHFAFQCIVISDLSTPATLRWYKTEPFGDLVRDEPPYVYVRQEFLIVMVYPNCSSECAKYLGEYKCVGDNGYSRDNKTITLDYEYKPKQGLQKAETWEVWKVIVIAGTIGLVLFLIGTFLGYRWKRIFCTFCRQTEDRKLPTPPNMYDRVDYETVGIPLEEIGNSGRSTTRACSMYDHVYYDSIDQVLKEIRSREGAMPLPPQEHIGCESIDTPQLEATLGCRSMMDGDGKYDNTGYTIPLKEFTNHSDIDQNQTHGYYPVRSVSTENPNSNEQSKETDTCSDLKTKETNSQPYLVSQEINKYIDLVSDEVNTHLEQSREESSQYMDISRKEVNKDVDLEPKYVNRYMDVKPELNLSRKDVNKYLDLNPKDPNQYLDLVSDEVSAYLKPKQKESNQYLDLTQQEFIQDVDMDLKDLNQYMDLDPELRQRNLYLDPRNKGLYQCLNLDAKEADECMDTKLEGVNQHIDLVSMEVNQDLGLAAKEVSENFDLSLKEVSDRGLDLDPRDVNQCTGLDHTRANPYLGLDLK